MPYLSDKVSVKVRPQHDPLLKVRPVEGAVVRGGVRRGFQFGCRGVVALHANTKSTCFLLLMKKSKSCRISYRTSRPVAEILLHLLFPVRHHYLVPPVRPTLRLRRPLGYRGVVEHGHDVDVQVHLEAVDDGHAEAAQHREHQAPTEGAEACKARWEIRGMLACWDQQNNYETAPFLLPII